MPTKHSQPRWSLDQDGCVHLSGGWDLITHSAARQRLVRELAAIEAPRELRWDLRGLDSLDSAGALLLWRLWGRRLPEQIHWRDDHSHWFRRLEKTPPAVASSESLVYHLLRPLMFLGASLTSAATTAWGIFVLCGQLLLDLGYAISHPRLFPWRGISASIYRTGVTSMLLLGVVGFLVGAVMAIQVGLEIRRLGADEFVIGLLGTAILRELGPVAAALILAGRSGAATTAGLGAMHLTEEYNALRTFGVSPTLRLVLPRVIGMGVAVPLLVVWTELWAGIGAALSTQSVLGLSETLFFRNLPQAHALTNFEIGLAKGALFGVTIAVISSYYGLTTRANTESLSEHTTISVVTSLSVILLIDVAAGALLTNVGLF